MGGEPACGRLGLACEEEVIAMYGALRDAAKNVALRLLWKLDVENGESQNYFDDGV